MRARNKGVPDAKLRSEFYRVQKDVLFLYFVQKQVEMWALSEREAIQLRVVISVKEIRALTMEKHELDKMRLGRVNLEGKRHPRPGSIEKSTRAHYQAHAAGWLPETEETLARILTFLAAARLISRRYFAGADILYPATRENLKLALETIANVREIYDDTILGAPQTDDEFRDYVLAMVEAREAPKNQARTSPTPKDLPDVSTGAKVLAEQWILMAKSETLEKLGEHEAAEALAERLLREHLGEDER